VAQLCDAGAGTAVRYPDTVAFADALADHLTDGDRSTEAGRRAAVLVTERHGLEAGVARIARVLADVAGRGADGAIRPAS
jgi:hypothetical protein